MVQEGSSTQGGVLQEASGCQLCLQTSVISIVLHPPWRAKSLSPKFTGAESVFLPNVDQLQPELKKKINELLRLATFKTLVFSMHEAKAENSFAQQV